ncbi:hypothetical protein [Vibrio owensii]|uniref:hypothetical protein n=1 Tax=Vibrio owensii TaxID=696485 RepID=UPI003CC6844B
MFNVIPFGPHALCFLDSEELGRGVYRLLANGMLTTEEERIKHTMEYGNGLNDIHKEALCKPMDVEQTFPIIEDPIEKPESLVWMNCHQAPYSVMFIRYGSDNIDECRYAMVFNVYREANTNQSTTELMLNGGMVRHVPSEIGKLF